MLCRLKIKMLKVRRCLKLFVFLQQQKLIIVIQNILIIIMQNKLIVAVKKTNDSIGNDNRIGIKKKH